MYQKQTQNQIVKDIRESYGTGFVLFNLNGASTENHGTEITLRGTPVAARATSRGTSLANFEQVARQDRLAAERAAGVVRLRHLAVRQRAQRHAARVFDDVADRLVLPAQQQGRHPDRSDHGAPASVDRRSSTTGYDRQPNFTIGLTNNVPVQALPR